MKPINSISVYYYNKTRYKNVAKGPKLSVFNFYYDPGICKRDPCYDLTKKLTFLTYFVLVINSNRMNEFHLFWETHVHFKYN